MLIVAPLAGAWIEIIQIVPYYDQQIQSLPSRERGLKCAIQSSREDSETSLPSRERGLK